MYTYNKHSTPLRTQRVARVTAARVARNQTAYQMAVQQVAAQYGVAVPVRTHTMHNPRVAGTVRFAPSTTPNACRQVHALAAQHGYHRANTLAACHAAGINPATASTQFALAKKAAMQG